MILCAFTTLLLQLASVGAVLEVSCFVYEIIPNQHCGRYSTESVGAHRCIHGRVRHLLPGHLSIVPPIPSLPSRLEAGVHIFLRMPVPPLFARSL